MKARKLAWSIAFTTASVLWFGPSVVEGTHGSEDLVETITVKGVKVNTLTAGRVKFLLDAREKFFFIDLRPAKHFQEKRLPTARSIPIEEFDKRFAEIPRIGRVILYCDCAEDKIIEKAIFLDRQGYQNVVVMLDGFQEWLKRKFPLETGSR